MGQRDDDLDLEDNLNDEHLENNEDNLNHDGHEDNHDDNNQDTRLNGEGHEDAELNNAENDEEREAIRERRRQERQERKQRQREREDSLRRELAARDTVINELREQVNAIQRKTSGAELAQIENAKRQTHTAYQNYKTQLEVAMKAGDAAGVTSAVENMQLAQKRFDELGRIETAYKQTQSQPQPLDPRLMSHAQDWMSKNKWYDPTGRDEDSHIAMTIDQRMAQEGWDPTTKDYWNELDKRLRNRLPHRYQAPTRERGNGAGNGADKGQSRPRSPVAGSGRESTAGGNGNKSGYTLSAERVQALKDAGIWDDPKQRTEAIKRYQEYDKANRGQ